MDNGTYSLVTDMTPLRISGVAAESLALAVRVHLHTDDGAQAETARRGRWALTALETAFKEDGRLPAESLQMAVQMTSSVLERKDLSDYLRGRFTDARDEAQVVYKAYLREETAPGCMMGAALLLLAWVTGR